MTTDTRTPAEIEYDRLALSTRAIGAQPEVPQAIDSEDLSIPPVAGLPDDQPLLFDTIGTTMVGIDRRDGSMIVCEEGENRHILIDVGWALALYQFFQHSTIKDVMVHALYNYHMAHGSPELKHALTMVNDILGPMPPLPEAGHARVSLTRHVCDDEVDTERFGKEIGTEFHCGGVSVYFPDDLRYALLEPTNLHIDQRLDIGDLPLEHAEYFISIAHKAQVLLSDPRVQALRAAVAKKAAEVRPC